MFKNTPKIPGEGKVGTTGVDWCISLCLPAPERNTTGNRFREVKRWKHDRKCKTAFSNFIAFVVGFSSKHCCLFFNKILTTHKLLHRIKPEGVNHGFHIILIHQHECEWPSVWMVCGEANCTVHGWQPRILKCVFLVPFRLRSNRTNLATIATCEEGRVIEGYLLSVNRYTSQLQVYT